MKMILNTFFSDLSIQEICGQVSREEETQETKRTETQNIDSQNITKPSTNSMNVNKGGKKQCKFKKKSWPKRKLHYQSQGRNRKSKYY